MIARQYGWPKSTDTDNEQSLQGTEVSKPRKRSGGQRWIRWSLIGANGDSPLRSPLGLFVSTPVAAVVAPSAEESLPAPDAATLLGLPLGEPAFEAQDRFNKAADSYSRRFSKMPDEMRAANGKSSLEEGEEVVDWSSVCMNALTTPNYKSIGRDILTWEPQVNCTGDK
ncbi:hypothetical protein BJX76DRAFT_359253 [Aspergillus varians]